MRLKDELSLNTAEQACNLLFAEDLLFSLPNILSCTIDIGYHRILVSHESTAYTNISFHWGLSKILTIKTDFSIYTFMRSNNHVSSQLRACYKIC
jgi:hypothetical protein